MSGWADITLVNDYSAATKEDLMQAIMIYTKDDEDGKSKDFATVGEYLAHWISEQTEYSSHQLMQILVQHVACYCEPTEDYLYHERKIYGELCMAGGSLFTKKHYLALGAAIGKAIEGVTKTTKPEHLESTLTALSVIVTELTDTFKRDNSRFKREDFLKSLVVKPKAET